MRSASAFADRRRLPLAAAGFTVLALTMTGPHANAQTLSGTIDMHAHGDPDGTARKIDVIDLAKLARAAGMRAIVLKNHYEPTASLAYLVRKEVPGIEVFGGISLDLTVGGVNPAAVDWMTKVKGGYGKVVWLPTFDSESQVARTNEQRPFAPVMVAGLALLVTCCAIAVDVRGGVSDFTPRQPEACGGPPAATAGTCDSGQCAPQTVPDASIGAGDRLQE